MKALLIVSLFFFLYPVNSQSVEALDILRSKLDAIEGFTVNLELETAVDFIQMPVKKATMSYRQGEPVKINSDDFVLIPKRGVDLVMSELFRYPFITVPRGQALVNGRMCEVMNIIPEDKRADFAIATLYLDERYHRMMQVELQTRKEGAYSLLMFYSTEDDLLPEKVEVSFEVEKVKIPIRYLAREGEVDKKALRDDGPKQGKVILYLTDYDIALVK